MEKQGLTFTRELEMTIYYNGVDVGTRRVELKALIKLEDVHLAQGLNYLEAYRLATGLLINFGAGSLEYKRITNEHKFARQINN